MRGIRLEKDFPVIRPTTSRYAILDLLHGSNPDVVRNAARKAGFHGETDILLAAPLPSPPSPASSFCNSYVWRLK